MKACCLMSLEFSTNVFTMLYVFKVYVSCQGCVESIIDGHLSAGDEVYVLIQLYCLALIEGLCMKKATNVNVHPMWMQAPKMNKLNNIFPSSSFKNHIIPHFLTYIILYQHLPARLYDVYNQIVKPKSLRSQRSSRIKI